MPKRKDPIETEAELRENQRGNELEESQQRGKKPMPVLRW